MEGGSEGAHIPCLLTKRKSKKEDANELIKYTICKEFWFLKKSYFCDPLYEKYVLLTIHPLFFWAYNISYF